MAKSPLPNAAGPSRHVMEETVMDDRAGTPKDPEFIRPGRQHFIYGHDPKKSWVDDNAIITTDKD